MAPLDIISASILVGFVVVGAVRGVLLTVLWLLSLTLSYAAAIIAPMYFAATVAVRFGLSRLMAGILVSIIAMFVVSMTFSIIRRSVLRRRYPRPEPGKEKKPGPAISVPSRFLGGLLGGLCGIVVTAFVGWIYDLASVGPIGDLLPDASVSMTARVSENVMYGAINASMRQVTDDPATARVVAAVVSHPSRTVDCVVVLASDPEIQDLVRDKVFLGAFFAGDAEQLSHHADLMQVLRNDETVQVLEAMGVMPENGVAGVPDRLAAVGGRVGAVVHDPATRDAMASLEADGLLQPGNAAQLMADPRFLTILGGITGKQPAAPAE